MVAISYMVANHARRDSLNSQAQFGYGVCNHIHPVDDNHRS